ncbi:tripartite tricarboxylate transporter substrate binding protein [Alkalicoccobacillus plakortidis]|uniref:Tripartite tricarboxylate transporter substrate binding protein n=1 Tax=Alkalicoccobacillus plakortidis TaxID=444060 RepID=A0ABT0XJ03_9BACI|nr:tripartite tricarboxylate transporter substrate binding protein [Alkalicoccobacillus plakortidis]MCM2675888.1 tripartite tricarboxylate transporter substrate binding protein [Alkalicoccobacillus plakortidis]
MNKLWTGLGLSTVLLLGACGGNGSSGESAEDYPSKNIEIMVPYSAGGGTDILARSFAELLKEDIDQGVAVVNREGGGGAVGMQNGVSANPDGYTVSMVTVELLTLPQQGLANFTYDEFRPVVQLNEDPAAITVKADAPWDTIEEFLADAESNVLDVGNSGSGAIWHLAAAGLAKEAGVEFNYVPYEGAAPAITALMGGHIDAVSVSPGEVETQVEAGNLKVLGVMADERLATHEDVPTLKEVGYDISLGTWRGLAVPTETPDEIVAQMEEYFIAVGQKDEFREEIEKLNLGYKVASGEEFLSLMESQDDLFSDLISDLGLSN